MSRDNPWFYRADGGLDLGQFICFAFTVFACTVLWCSGNGTLSLTPESWGFLAACQIVVFVTWAARDRAEWLAKRGTPPTPAGVVGAE